MTLAFFVDVVLLIVDLEVVLIDVIDSLTLLIVNADFEIVSSDAIRERCIDDDERLSLIKIVNQLIFFFVIDIAYFAVFSMKLTKSSSLMRFSTF